MNPSMSNHVVQDDLNPAQRQAVDTDSRRVLVIAGAGSGKTKTLSRRIARLMMRGCAGQRVLAITFTRAAAAEMKERVGKVLALEPSWSGAMPEVRTLHSWGATLIRNNAADVSRTRDFSIYDDRDKNDIVRAIAESKAYPQAKTARFKTLWALPRMQEDYAERMRESNAIDYDMVESLTLRLLQHSPAAQAASLRRYDHIMVDEFQDTSLAQVLIVNHLYPQNLYVVGDPRQSIYRFRGAEPATIVSLTQDDNFEVVNLTTNYRSTPEVVGLANSVIGGEWLPMDAARPAGQAVRYFACFTEAEAVAAELAAAHRQGVAWGDMAVLGRNWGDDVDPSRRRGLARVRDVLKAQGVPVNYTGGSADPWSTDDGRSLARWLLLCVNPSDNNLAELIAEWGASKDGRRRFSPAEMAKLRAVAAAGRTTLLARMAHEDAEWKQAVDGMLAQVAMGAAPRRLAHIAIAELVGPAYQRRGLTSRLDELRTLVDAVADFSTLEDWRDWWTDRSTQERVVVGADQVTVTTVHASKGLEWPFVVVTNVDDSNYPSNRTSSTQEDREEDRRLLYVAVTRARDVLLLSMATETTPPWGGRPELQLPSRFVREAAPDLAVDTVAPPVTVAS